MKNLKEIKAFNPDNAYAPQARASNPTDKTVAKEERKIAGNISLFN